RVLLCHAQAVRPQLKPRIDAQQVFPERLCLVHPHLVSKILLSVQVSHIHAVKINEMKTSHPDPGKADCYVGPKTAKACHRHPGSADAGLDSLRVAVIEG